MVEWGQIESECARVFTPEIFERVLPKIAGVSDFYFQKFTDISFTDHGISQKKAREEEKESKQHAGKIM